MRSWRKVMMRKKRMVIKETEDEEDDDDELEEEEEDEAEKEERERESDCCFTLAKCRLRLESSNKFQLRLC
jgi:hypothetical protein